MSSKLQTPTPTTSKLDPSLKFVTITHPGHKFYGQAVEIIRKHKGPPITLIVKLPTGESVGLPTGWTNYEQAGPAPAPPTNLLDLSGLLEIVEILKLDETGGGAVADSD